MMSGTHKNPRRVLSYSSLSVDLTGVPRRHSSVGGMRRPSSHVVRLVASNPPITIPPMSRKWARMVAMATISPSWNTGRMTQASLRCVPTR
jgi:hypothetical protein